MPGELLDVQAVSAESKKMPEKGLPTGEPFDVVYTWVNHADPEWQKLHAQATQGRISPADEHASVNDPARFTDRGELYWSVRSVRKYAPWVRRIYVVTNCDLPAWASGVSNVVRVPHETVFPDPQRCLPTFNSRAIETVLHRVPGVSERFLYFNDDVFLCRPVKPDYFFWGLHGVRYTLSPHDIPYQKPWEQLRPVDVAAFNTSRLLKNDFGFMPRKKLQHTPHPLSRKILREIENKYARIVLSTRSHAFRDSRDLQMATTMHAYYAHCVGLGRPSELKTRYIDIADWRFLGLVHPFAPLLRGKYDTLCLNEVQELRYGRKLRDAIVHCLMRRLFL